MITLLNMVPSRQLLRLAQDQATKQKQKPSDHSSKLCIRRKLIMIMMLA